jgi:hypothetical protein
VRAGVELADGEVVLADRVYVCAGPEASTRLLLHSGVGDRSAAHWDACSIPCTVHNAGVGKGYHDHPTRTSSHHHAAVLSSRRDAPTPPPCGPESRPASVCMRASAVVDGFFSWRAYSARKSKLPPYKASLFTEESQVSLVTHGGYGFMHELDSFIKHKPLLRLLRLVHFLTPWWRHNREPFVFGGLFVTASFPDHRAQLQLHTADPLAPLHGTSTSQSPWPPALLHSQRLLKPPVLPTQARGDVGCSGRCGVDTRGARCAAARAGAGEHAGS